MHALADIRRRGVHALVDIRHRGAKLAPCVLSHVLLADLGMAWTAVEEAELAGKVYSASLPRVERVGSDVCLGKAHRRALADLSAWRWQGRRRVERTGLTGQEEDGGMVDISIS